MADNSFRFGPFADYLDNPILAPSKGFQSKAVYNPTVIKEGDRYWMLYRAEEADGLTGKIGIAQSLDGIRFAPHPEPVLSPDQPFDMGGCEDPRVLKAGESYYLF